MPERRAAQRAPDRTAPGEPLHRRWIALACTAGVLAVLAVGFQALPREDAPLPAIARYALEIALPQWKITEPVNEIVYGTRGFDTFGETFLLLAAVVSVLTLARQRERRQQFLGEEEAGEQEQRHSDPDLAGGNREGGVPESKEEQQARRAEAEEAGEDTLQDGASDHGSARRDRAMEHSRREPFAADTTRLGSTAPEHSAAMTVVVRVAARIAAVILAVAAWYLFGEGFSPGGGFPAGAAISGVAPCCCTQHSAITCCPRSSRPACWSRWNSQAPCWWWALRLPGWSGTGR